MTEPSKRERVAQVIRERYLGYGLEQQLLDRVTCIRVTVTVTHLLFLPQGHVKITKEITRHHATLASKVLPDPCEAMSKRVWEVRMYEARQQLRVSHAQRLMKLEKILEDLEE